MDSVSGGAADCALWCAWRDWPTQRHPTPAIIQLTQPMARGPRVSAMPDFFMFLGGVTYDPDSNGKVVTSIKGMSLMYV